MIFHAISSHKVRKPNTLTDVYPVIASIQLWPWPFLANYDGWDIVSNQMIATQSAGIRVWTEVLGTDVYWKQDIPVSHVDIISSGMLC